MKAIFSFLLLALVLLSCSKEKPTVLLTSELTGEWMLTERLMISVIFPGVTPQFQPVSDSKILVFNDQGQYACSGSTCIPGPSNIPSFGTYDENNNYILPTDCANNHGHILYTLEADTLIISYPCIEGCYEKFVKSE